MITTRTVVEEWIRTNTGAGPLSADNIDTAYQAAEQFVAARCRWPATRSDGTALPAPPDLVLAVCLLTARYLVRRNTVTGIVGIDELGGMQMPGIDPDVLRLMNPWRRVVIA